MSEGFEVYEQEIAEARIAHVEHQLEIAEVTADSLQEAYSDAVRAMFAMEDVGWNLLGSYEAEGRNLQQSKDIAAKLSQWGRTNPLLWRGREIRNSYLFSSPYEIGTDDAKTKITTQQMNVVMREDNQASVFGLSALETIEAERFHSGSTFTTYDRGTKTFQQIPFREIGDLLYDPNDGSKIQYVKREWSADVVRADGNPVAKEFKEWYPASRYEAPRGGYMSSIGGVKVVKSKAMIVSRVNLSPGDALGTPDCLAAAPWALAYSAYLRDGTKVLAALAEWAWKVTAKKRPTAERAAVSVRSERGAGGTLFTDMDVQALPKGDAVDLNTGRPLAAQVAASLGISIVILLADPGQSGAYGTAQTLSDPNNRTMQARREVNSEYLRECLRLVGVKNPEIVWAKMSPGSDKEEMEIVSQAWGTGLFHESEIRPRVAEIAHITITQDDPPEGFMYPNNADSLARKDIDADGSTQKMDGTNSMVNGQGQDNLGIGRTSKTVKSAQSKTKDSTSAVPA